MSDWECMVLMYRWTQEATLGDRGTEAGSQGGTKRELGHRDMERVPQRMLTVYVRRAM